MHSVRDAAPSAMMHHIIIIFNGMIRMIHDMIPKALDLRSLSMIIGTFIKAVLPIFCAASLALAAEPFIWDQYATENKLKPDQRLLPTSWTSQRCTIFVAGISLKSALRFRFALSHDSKHWHSLQQ
jgi:hypothetical protein